MTTTGHGPSATTARLRVHLTGYPTVFLGEEPLAGPASQRHRLALITLLALSPERILSRDRIVGLLWPESDATSARNLLNVSVHVLRRALGGEALVSRGDSLALAATWWIDVIEFRRAVRDGALDAAVGCVRAPLLEGFHLEHTVEFDQWAALQRSALTAEYRDVLATLANEASQRGDLTACTKWWRALANDDPLNSRAVVQLMLALERQGAYGNAIHLAHEHAQRLQEELEARPDAEFSALVQRLREHAAAQSIQWNGPEAETRDATRLASRAEVSVGKSSPNSARWILTVGVATALLLGVGWTLQRWEPFRSRTALSQPEVVAVLPFTFRGGADSLALSHGMAELLATGLDVPGEWRAADPSAVLNALARLKDTALHSRRSHVATAVGATRVITGEVAPAAPTGDPPPGSVDARDRAGDEESSCRCRATPTSRDAASRQRASNRRRSRCPTHAANPASARSPTHCCAGPHSKCQSS